MRVDRLERATLDAWIASSLRAGRASRTLEGDLGRLHQAWRWAREVGMIDVRELPHARIVVRPTREDHTPTVGEAAEVVRAIRARAAAHRARVEALGRPLPVDASLSRRRKASAAATLTSEAMRLEAAALAVEVLAATGLRRGELAGLRATDLHRRGEMVLATVRAGTSKTGRGRVVPVLEPLATRLETWAAEHPDLWGRAAYDSLEHLLATTSEGLGQPRWTAQGLRRLAVDRLYTSGADPGEAAAVLGHSAKVAIEHYRRPGIEDQAAAMKRAGLGSLPEGEVIEFRPAQKTRTGP